MPSATAASVPGRGRSQRSAPFAAGVRAGSMTTVLAPFAFARLSACHWAASAADGLRPTISAQLVLSMSSPPIAASPVSLSLSARQPPHRSWFISQLGEPSARISSATMAPRLKKADDTAPISDSGPCRSRTSSRRSRTVSSAVSQSTGSQSPAPRSPRLRIGCTSRSGWSVSSRMPRMPLTQNAPFEPGWSKLGPTRVTAPSSSVTSAPQRVLHSQQVVGTSIGVPVAGPATD